MGDFCIYIFNRIYESKSFTFIYFTFHFLLLYLFRIIGCYFLFKFAFLNADLRPLVYILLLFFLTWIFSFFDYYFFNFRLGNEEYLNELLIITYKNNEKNLIIIDSDYAKCSVEDLKFQLSSEGFKQGFYSHENFNLLVNK